MLPIPTMLELFMDIRFSDIANDSEIRQDALVDRILELRRLSPFANLAGCPTQEAVDAISILAQALPTTTSIQELTGS